MTYRDVYVGELGEDDALDWHGTFATGNIPTRIGPFFPRAGDAWNLLHRRVDAGGSVGERVDWGAVAVRVTVDDLRAFVSDCYGSDVPAQVGEFIDTLDPARRYALVASEL